MTLRTRSIVSTLASLALAAVATAQVSNNPNQPGSQGQPGSMGRPEMRAGSGQAEQMINSQLRQFAQDPKTAADKLFVLHAACGNQMEIEFARQAQQKAQNQQVKQLAQEIMQDHQQAQQQLQQVAQKLGVQIPSDLDEEKQQTIQIVTSLPTDQFEKHYVADMQADHLKDVAKYRAVAQMTQNDQVRQYAQQTLPHLQQHLDRVQQAAMALGLPTGSSDAVPAAGRLEGSNNDNSRTGGISGSSIDSNRTGSGSSGSSSGNMNSGGNQPTDSSNQGTSTGTGGRGRPAP